MLHRLLPLQEPQGRVQMRSSVGVEEKYVNTTYEVLVATLEIPIKDKNKKIEIFCTFHQIHVKWFRRGLPCFGSSAPPIRTKGVKGVFPATI